MNTQLLIELAKAKHQALLTERSGYGEPSQPRQASWMSRIQEWLTGHKTLSRAVLKH